MAGDGPAEEHRVDEANRTLQPTATWAELEAAAPELAAAIRGRFAASLHHVLGTIRRDGSPRLSGTEVAIDDEEIRLGMMPGSHKLRDVRRDPRVELHSAPLERTLVEGDARLAGTLVEDGGDESDGAFFRLAIQRAGLVRVVGRELEVTSWTPAGGPTVQRRG